MVRSFLALTSMLLYGCLVSENSDSVVKDSPNFTGIYMLAGNTPTHESGEAFDPGLYDPQSGYSSARGKHTAQIRTLFENGMAESSNLIQGCVVAQADESWLGHDSSLTLTTLSFRVRQDCHSSWSDWNEVNQNTIFSFASFQETQFETCNKSWCSSSDSVSWTRYPDKGSAPFRVRKDTSLYIRSPLTLYIQKTSETEIEKWEWKVGPDDNFFRVSAGDTLITTPNIPFEEYLYVARATTFDGNSFLDTVKVEIIAGTPKALAGEDLIVSISDSVKLSGSGTDNFGTVTSYAWDIGNQGNFEKSPDGTVTFSVPDSPEDSYLCILRVTDSDGFTDTDTLSIRVLLDPPVANAGPDRVIQIHDSLVITGNGFDLLGSIEKYEWDFGNTGTFVEYPSGSVLIPDPAVIDSAYPSVLRVTDDDGNQSLDTMLIDIQHRTRWGFRSNFVRALPDTGFMVAGSSEGKAWLAGYNEMGIQQSSGLYASAVPDHWEDEITNRYILRPDGSVVILARLGDGKIQVSEIDPQGQELWLVSHETQSLPRGIIELQGGGYLAATGSSELVRFGTSGELMWKRNLDSTMAIDVIVSINTGNLLAFGTIGRGTESKFICQLLDTAGNLLNHVLIPGTQPNQRANSGISLGNSAVVVGTFNSALKVDSMGNPVWMELHSVNYEDELRGLTQARDGGFLLVGHLGSLSTSLPKGIAIRTDLNGKTIWRKEYSADARDFFMDTDLMSNGNYVIVGQGESGRQYYSWTLLIDDEGNIK